MNDRTEQLACLLRQCSRVLELHVCFHDYQRICTLPLPQRSHHVPACLRVKNRGAEAACIHFDRNTLPPILLNQPGGMIVTCPFGFAQLAVAVFADQVPFGILFAGVRWLKRGPAPKDVPRATRPWMEERLPILHAIALKIGRMTLTRPGGRDAERRELVLATIRERLSESIRLSDLAGPMHLSASRASHVIRAIFHCTLPQLVHAVRIEEAARRIVFSARSLAELADELGFSSQSHFTRVFLRHFGCTPGTYRKQQTQTS